MGAATLYRNLESLAASGEVLKYIIPGGTRACYQLLEPPAGHPECYYLICIECGRMIPLEYSSFMAIHAHI